MRTDYTSQDSLGQKVVVGDLIVVLPSDTSSDVLSKPPCEGSFFPRRFYAVVDAILETGLMWAKTGDNRLCFEPPEVVLALHTTPLTQDDVPPVPKQRSVRRKGAKV